MFTLGETYVVVRRPARSTSATTSSCRWPRSASGSSASTRSSCARRSSRRASEDYVTTARAKGISESRVLRSHAVPNALLPTVSLIGINLGYIIAGAITVEVVFSWPGLGTLTQEALEARDYPRPAGDLPASWRSPSSSPTSSPTSSTAASTRGCGRERRAGDRVRSDRGPLGAAASPRWRDFARPLRAPPGGLRRPGHHRLLRGPGARPGALRRSARDGHQRDRQAPRAAVG